MTVGSNLKKIRKERKLTQKEMAKILGISHSYMSELENDKRNLSLQTLNNLADKIGVSTYYLLEGEKTINDVAATEQEKIYSFLEEFVKNPEGEKTDEMLTYIKKAYRNDCLMLINDSFPEIKNYSNNEVFSLGSLLSLIINTRSDDTIVEKDKIQDMYEFIYLQLQTIEQICLGTNKYSDKSILNNLFTQSLNILKITTELAKEKDLKLTLEGSENKNIKELEEIIKNYTLHY